MSDPESPAERLSRLIAEEKNRHFAALEPFREVIQSEIEMGTPQRCIIRNLAKEGVVVSRYTFSLYLRHTGLKARRKRAKKAAVPAV
jgi:hypothetical protein